MTKYFTYHIFNRITNQHYYGARWKKGCHPSDLWTTYFTSSKLVADLIELYGTESFDVEIRKTFETRRACQQWEQRVLTKLRVKTRNDWLNIAISAPPIRVGYKHTTETLTKMRKPKNIPWSKERKEAKRIDELNKIKNGKKMPSTKGLTIPSVQIQCPHCQKIGGSNGMKRYHFNNCKLRSDA